MLEGKNVEACPLLEESQRLDPGLGTQFNLAACYEAVGKLASAYNLFEQVATQARARSQGEREQVARTRAAAVQPKLSRLSIVVSAAQVDRVQVDRDGANVARSELGVAVPVDSGMHQIRAYGPGLTEWVSQIDVPSDARLHTLVVPPLAEKVLEPIAASPAAVTGDASEAESFWAPTHRKVGLIAAGVGVLGIGVGSIFGLRAIDKADESDRLGCARATCPTPDGVEARDEAQVAGNVATVSMIAGLAGLATAAILFLVVDGTNDNATTLPVIPRVAGRGGELVWQGQF